MRAWRSSAQSIDFRRCFLPSRCGIQQQASSVAALTAAAAVAAAGAGRAGRCAAEHKAEAE